MAKDLADEAYSGVAAYGRFSSTIGAIIGVLIMIVMFYFGSTILFSNKKRTTATVVAAKQDGTSLPSNQGGGVPVSMTLRYEYPAGTTRTVSLSRTMDVIPAVGEKIPIAVNALKPDQPTVKPAGKALGGLLMIGGLLIGGISIASAHFAAKNRGFAATMGVADVASAVF